MRAFLLCLIWLLHIWSAKARPVEFKCGLLEPVQGHSEIWLRGSAAALHQGTITTLAMQLELGFSPLSGLGKQDPLFLISSSPKALIHDCLQAIRLLEPTITIAALKTITAKELQNSIEMPVIRYTPDFDIVFVHSDRSTSLTANLTRYNFAPVMKGFIYRSRKLGSRGLETLLKVFRQEGQQLPRTVASIHVMGFGDSKGGNYNIEEMDFCEKKKIFFMHSFHHQPKQWVYIDGTNPANIDINDPDHGNVFKSEVIERFLPSQKVRDRLHIDWSVNHKFVRDGNIDDFLSTLDNLIDAPWPLLVHCKGGRHKTGMIAMIFEYLLRERQQVLTHLHTVSVPIFHNRIERFLNSKEMRFANLFGPLYQNFELRDEEMGYFHHNHSVFRWENIDFVRSFLAGRYFDERQAMNWEILKKKFAEKQLSLELPKPVPLRQERKLIPSTMTE